MISTRLTVTDPRPNLLSEKKKKKKKIMFPPRSKLRSSMSLFGAVLKIGSSELALLAGQVHRRAKSLRR